MDPSDKVTGRSWTFIVIIHLGPKKKKKAKATSRHTALP